MVKHWFEQRDNTIQLAVQVVPRSSKNTVDSVVADADGRKWLKVRVTAPPDKGKANAAVQKLLAKTWKIPISSISIASGVTSRKKIIHISGEVKPLMKAILGWYGENLGNTRF